MVQEFTGSTDISWNTIAVLKTHVWTYKDREGEEGGELRNIQIIII
jgi:hypothetical protein